MNEALDILEESASLADFFGAWDLFKGSVLAGTICGAVAGMLGVYVLVRRMIFFSAALSQVAGAGVAGAFYIRHIDARWLAPLKWLAHSPTTFATVITTAMTLWLARDRSVLGRKRDARLGLAFILGAALTLVLGTRIVEELHDINTLLFGTAVTVMPEDVHLLVLVCGGVLAMHLWLSRGFIAVCVDPEGARVRKVPVRALNIILLLSLALVISTGTRILGALPVFAFSILPAMAALKLCKSLGKALWLASLLGASSGAVGYLVSYLYEFPVGASQALVAGTWVLIAEYIQMVREQFASRPKKTDENTR